MRMNRRCVLGVPISNHGMALIVIQLPNAFAIHSGKLAGGRSRIVQIKIASTNGPGSRILELIMLVRRILGHYTFLCRRSP